MRRFTFDLHEGADGRTYVRMVDDVMAMKPNFLASLGYSIFLAMVLHARAPSARAEPRYKKKKTTKCKKEMDWHNRLLSSALWDFSLSAPVFPSHQNQNIGLFFGISFDLWSPLFSRATVLGVIYSVTILQRLYSLCKMVSLGQKLKMPKTCNSKRTLALF